jgi:hypothetical protein
MVYTLRFFPLQNVVRFIILTYLVPILFTFYIQDVLKLKKNNYGAKRLSWSITKTYLSEFPAKQSSLQDSLTELPNTETLRIPSTFLLP